MTTKSPMRIKEGSVDAPTRHPIDWQNPDYYDREQLNTELERVFDICHGCRRCVSLCHAFPTLFDLVDESATLEVDGVAREDYGKVVEHCYLCDLCYMTKCPYVPPHEWNVDFPHLMLRAKAVDFKEGKTKWAHKLLTATDAVGKLASIPVVSKVVNAANQSKMARKTLKHVLGVHPKAPLPEYDSRPLTRRFHEREHEHKGMAKVNGMPDSHHKTTGKVALFATCYGNYNEPQLGEDLVAIFEHNSIEVQLAEPTKCCGMPKLELGDFQSVQQAKQYNIPILVDLINQGWDIVAPIPSCVLMFKQELPLLFPDDETVRQVKQAIFDPFEYLMLRHKDDLLRLDFRQSLGVVFYHAACHLRVQNMGLKTRDLLNLIPNTSVEVIERCSGHDGTYAVKDAYHEISKKICKPIVTKIQQQQLDYFSSDCPMAGHQIEHGLNSGQKAIHPLSLFRKAYGI